MILLKTQSCEYQIGQYIFFLYFKFLTFNTENRLCNDQACRCVRVSQWSCGCYSGPGWGRLWLRQLVSGCLPPWLSPTQLRLRQPRAGSGITVEWGVGLGAVWGQLWASWIIKLGPSRLDFDNLKPPNLVLKVKQLRIYSWLEPFRVIAVFIVPHLTETNQLSPTVVKIKLSEQSKLPRHPFFNFI